MLLNLVGLMKCKEFKRYLDGILACFVCICFSFNAYAQSCSYNTWRWNVHVNQSVQQERVVHSYDSLMPEERDHNSGCTVCEEDQVGIEVAGLPIFHVCKIFAPRIKQSLEEILRRGERVNSVIAYRVGRSRGKIDKEGNRTEFSNHSFGVALDINMEHNGLYKRCAVFGPQCQLSRGGAWKPATDPYSLTSNGLIVRTLKANGLRWGGEISGLQKDFMHFSPTGY